MRRLLLKLRRRRNLHDDLADELAFHQDEARRNGNPTPLGSAGRITEESLDLWRFAWIENLWRDVVYAAKGLAHSPTLVASAMRFLAGLVSHHASSARTTVPCTSVSRNLRPW